MALLRGPGGFKVEYGGSALRKLIEEFVATVDDKIAHKADASRGGWGA